MENELSEVSFEVEAVLRAARERAGLDDFGEDSFREPLRRLLDALDSEANLTLIGRATQHARIVGSLVTRLSARDHRKRHPEIADEVIRAPLVIVGLARTGTTMLQRLLAADPAVYSVRWWESRSPAPIPGSDWRRDDPRIREAHAEIELILETTPQLATIHPWDAEGPDEEVMLIEHSFLSWVPESGANVPSYRSWLTEQDVRPGYDYLYEMLQFLQWQKKQAGHIADRWILKTPMHIGYLDLLFERFPDAKVVQTHRDPLETIPSLASFYLALWQLATEAADPLEVGLQVLDRWSRGLARCLEVRDSMPDDRFLDVWYRDTQSEPMAVVERIYDFAGARLTDAARRAMQDWGDENRRDKRAQHDYTLEAFGYTREGIADAFAAYRERFILGRAAAGGS